MMQFRCLDSDLYVSGTYMVRWYSVEQENVSPFEGILHELTSTRAGESSLSSAADTRKCPFFTEFTIV